MKVLSKDETKQLLSLCHKHNLRDRETGATEVNWELPGDMSFNVKYIASGWFDGASSSVSSMDHAATRLGISFSFEGIDANELRYCAATRSFDTLQPSEAEQEAASLRRLVDFAEANGLMFNPATCSGLIIV